MKKEKRKLNKQKTIQKREISVKSTKTIKKRKANQLTK